MTRLWLARKIAPAGYVVVPEEPTRTMLRAAARVMSPGLRPTPEWVSNAEKHAIRYRAMVAEGRTA